MELPRGISIVSEQKLQPKKIVCPVVESYKRVGMPKYDPNITLAELSDYWFTSALSYCGGNKSKTAKVLGVAKETVYRRLRETK